MMQLTCPGWEGLSPCGGITSSIVKSITRSLPRALTILVMMQFQTASAQLQRLYHRKYSKNRFFEAKETNQIPKHCIQLHPTLRRKQTVLCSKCLPDPKRRSMEPHSSVLYATISLQLVMIRHGNSMFMRICLLTFAYMRCAAWNRRPYMEHDISS
jgi:hypothetical protein